MIHPIGAAVVPHEFILGAASSLFASSLLLVATHLEDIRYLLAGFRRYRHLEGEWVEYHLTTNSRHDPPLFWSAHQQVINVTSFGRIRGTSRGRHTLVRGYRVSGAIRGNVMRIRLTNRDANEPSATFTYPRLLSKDTLIGLWVGYDYDESISAGPTVLSRNERTAAELTDLVRNERLLSVVGKRSLPPVLEFNAADEVPGESGGHT